MGLVLLIGAAMSAGGLTGDLPVFLILEIIAWVLVPLYVKRFRWSYIGGIIISFIALVGDLIGHVIDAKPWRTLADPASLIAHVIFNLVGIACIYFSYFHYRELK